MASLPSRPVAPQSPPGFERRAAELRAELRGKLPEALAASVGAQYSPGDAGRGRFALRLFTQPVSGTYPDFTFLSASGTELPEFQQLLLLYYFATADGTALSGKWVSFADLPGGRMYAQAFQGYSGDEVVKFFEQDLPAFRQACERAGGQAMAVADAAYTFQALPMVSAQFVYWLGDDDFPSSCKILFDATATHYVPIDACAILGSQLTRKIIKHAA